MWSLDPITHAECVADICSVCNTKDTQERHALALRLIVTRSATTPKPVKFREFSSVLASAALNPQDFLLTANEQETK